MNQIKTNKIARLCALYDHFYQSSKHGSYGKMCRCEQLAIYILCGTHTPDNASWYYFQRHFIKAWKTYKYSGKIVTVL